MNKEISGGKRKGRIRTSETLQQVDIAHSNIS